MSDRTTARAPLAVLAVVLTLVTSVASGAPAVAAPSGAVAGADRACLAAPAGGAQPAATPCPGVRPGALVSSGGEECTLAFLFKGADGRIYAGTAGHCTLDAPGETTFAGTQPPVASDASGARIGVYAYAVLRRPFDFALIRLDRGVEWDAEMCHFGGPTGVYADRSEAATVLHHYGNGQGVGRAPVADEPVAPARSAMAPSTSDRLEIRAYGAASPGDSGSPVVVEDRRALGILVGLGEGDIVILRLGPLVSRAERVLGRSLRLLKPPV